MLQKQTHNDYYFWCILLSKREIIFCTDLIYLRDSKTEILAWIFSLTIFSFVGVPPFAGFWGKFYILRNIFYLHSIDINNFFLFFYILFISFLSAIAYLNLIKLIWFKPKILDHNLNLDEILNQKYELDDEIILFANKYCEESKKLNVKFSYSWEDLELEVESSETNNSKLGL